MDAISNYDEEGGEHFPGWSMEALQYIYEVRGAAANGHETLDTDAIVIAAFLPIEGATGLPVRMWAIVEE